MPPELTSRLGSEGIMAAVVILLFLNFLRGIVQMYLDRKDRGKIAEAAACNYPADMVPPLRAAVMQQQVYAQQQREATDRLETAMSRSAEAHERLTEKIIEALAEFKAGRSRR